MPASIVFLGAALFVLTVLSCYTALTWYFRWRRGRFTRGIQSRRINLARKRALRPQPQRRRSMIGKAFALITALCMLLFFAFLFLFALWTVFVLWVGPKALKLEDRYIAWRTRNVVAAAPEEPITFGRRPWLRKGGFYL